MIISGSSANRIRLARQRRVEINRCNSSTVRSKTSTACHTKCPGGRLYRAHFGGFMANEAREVVSVESNNLLVYFFLVHLPGKLRVQMRTLLVLL